MTDDPRDPTPRPDHDHDPGDHEVAGRRGATGATGATDASGAARSGHEVTGQDGATDPGAAAGPDPVDGLASAVLDGEVDPDAARAALRRPEVAARVTQLAAAREAVSSAVPPPDPEARERAIGAALHAFDADDADTGDSPAPTRRPLPGDELAAARAARAGRSPGRVPAARWLGAAAAAIVVAVVGVAIAQSAGRSDSETASNEAGETTESFDAADGEAGAGADGRDRDDAASDEDAATEQPIPEDAAPGATEMREPGGVPLGGFASADDLLDAAAGTLGGDRGDRSPDDADALGLQDRCDARVPAVLAGSGAWLVAWGTVDGTRVEAWLGGADDDPLLVALDPGCSVLATRPSP